MKAPDPTRRLRLTIAFDGSAYHGWQSGRSGKGAADQLAAVLEQTLGVKADLVSSSRTDSGVHAHGLVAHADVPRHHAKQRPDALVARINAHLPATLRVRAARWVGSSFDARFDATAKQYRYQLWNEAVMHPLWQGRAWHVPGALDLKAMRAAARRLLGTHDFRAFTSRRDGTLGSTRRTIHKLMLKREGPLWTVVIEADGFLYKMCRAIVGTLVCIGQRRMSLAELDALLKPASPRTPGVNAPAHGLMLWSVKYARKAKGQH